jgi:enoyl-CoA hydratase/carnithine racemase
MSEAPFRVRRDAGILYLTLDTPRASVNIFDRKSADQLISIFEKLPPRLEAIVFESAKPKSFINGVGLMMASSVRSVAAAKKIAGPILRAYQLVEEAPIPTIAAIRGNCFGCGVEFALRCTYRLAADDVDTQFYMTELHDYLFTPAFGAVSRLPPLLGLERAADFLLWGERWSAREALRFGLIDRLLAKRAIDQVLAKGVERKRPQRGSIARHRARIARLPPAIEPTYRGCLDMMAHGGDELALSAKTAARPECKAALGFFFIRQIAGELRKSKAVSKAKERRAIEALLIAHFKPLVRALDRIDVPTINQTLRKFGFVERPHALLERHRMERLVPGAKTLRDPRLGKRTDARLLRDLRASWSTCARDLLNGTISHSTILDVIAREAFDFPLQHRSLCWYLGGFYAT